MKVLASNVQSNDVVVTLGASEQFEWVTGSLRISNSATGNHWKTVTHPLLAPGVNTGSYGPGGGAFLNFALRLGDETHFRCGETTVVIPLNVASTTGTVAVDASVAVARYC